MTNEAEIRRRILLLTEMELRVVGLVSLGWENERVAQYLGRSVNGIKTLLLRARPKLGVTGNRIMLALFYVNFILPEDCLPDYQRGEKLSLWRGRAEELRALLKAAGVLTPQVVTAAMLLTNPEHAGKSSSELGALMRSPGGEPLSGEVYKSYLNKITRNLPEHKRMCRVRTAVLATLAPLDAV